LTKTGVRFFHCDRITFPLPEGHRFPIRKYSLLRKRIERMRLVPDENIVESPAASDEQIHLAHNTNICESSKSAR
jgi:acetoin utilization deacetylase AcuC-like enzyme